MFSTVILQIIVFWLEAARLTRSEILVPITGCGYPEDQEMAKIYHIEVDPPCQAASEGYCGIPLGRNITLKVMASLHHSYDELFLSISRVDRTFEFETFMWPVFSTCGIFNITCPHKENLVHGYINRPVPNEVPPVRSDIRIRLVGKSTENDYSEPENSWGSVVISPSQLKNVIICRGTKLEFIKPEDSNDSRYS